MKTIDLIEMSIRNLWRRKVRTLLTILGVIIGASSIILMLSLGIAMDRNFEQQIMQMGSLTTISVSSNNYGDPKAPKLDDKALESFKKLGYVERVVPIVQDQFYVTFGKYRSNYPMQVYGMDAEDMAALGYQPVEGRLLGEGEKTGIVIGGGLTYEFTKIGKRFNWRVEQQALPIQLEEDKMTLEIVQFDYQTGKPLLKDQEGNKIKVPKVPELKVVGMLSENNWEVSRSIYVPREIFNTLVVQKKKYEEKLNGKQTTVGGNSWGRQDNQKGVYQEVKVKVNDRNEVLGVQEKIKDLGYYAYSSMDQLTQMKKISGGIQMALGGIGAVSLFVAAIGIANTMMMSIYERTKEIGIMKVIGAKIIDIKKMFLIEAILIGAIGGSIGVLFSYGVSLLINTVGGGIAGMMGMYGATQVSVIPVWLALGAIVFSTLIGLISGYLPARRAMKLSALTAIKTE
ncbi:ABC transporter [Sporanaerobium hydrogeniformans]|uniref:ABC transporter n=1 Tax=Sporanaerobium hydrogeniformans TaxID=3072179 RepID=A0AC61DHQ3_9FIRM|nr:ABC transporter permease [Sporanaerobium hydrogeniformans]PHV72320.1 ABC transporter [Sporanaerobium hydrogeniformans]